MSLTTFDLPIIFTCGVELAQATINFRPEKYPGILAELNSDFSDDDENESMAALNAKFEWHHDLDAIVHASNRLKRALGAKGPLDAGDQLGDKTRPEWNELKNRFKYAAHSAKAREAFFKLAHAAVDLSGYATLREPDVALRESGLQLLRQGLVGLWAALSEQEQKMVRPLLQQSNEAIGWPPSLEGDPPIDIPEFRGNPIGEDFFKVIDFSGGFATRSSRFLEEKAAALARAFPAEPMGIPIPPLHISHSANEEVTPMVRFPLAAIFEQAVIYASAIWDRRSQVQTDGDPFDCIPDFSEIRVARYHFAAALRIPSYTVQGWKDAVKKWAVSEQARQGLIHLNEAEEWEHLPRDRHGNRQPGSLGTAFGLLKRGLKEIYDGMTPEEREAVKPHLSLIRERWDKNFPETESADGQKDTKKKPIPRGEANILIRQYLKKVPKATIRKIQGATNVSAGAISQSLAWQAHQAAKIIRKRQSNRRVKTIQLDEKMLKVLGQKNDPATSMTAEEAALRHLIENATPDERARLNKLSPRDLAEHIQAVLEQAAERVDSKKESDLFS